MANNASKPKAVQQTKVQKIQKIYGKNTAVATLEEASAYLKSKDFKPLADFLIPAK